MATLGHISGCRAAKLGAGPHRWSWRLSSLPMDWALSRSHHLELETFSLWPLSGSSFLFIFFKYFFSVFCFFWLYCRVSLWGRALMRITRLGTAAVSRDSPSSPSRFPCFKSNLKRRFLRQCDLAPGATSLVCCIHVVSSCIAKFPYLSTYTA